MRYPKRSHSPGGRRFGTFLGGSKFMVKKVLLLAVLALALPLAAFADSSIDITNRGGTLTGNCERSFADRFHADRCWQRCRIKPRLSQLQDRRTHERQRSDGRHPGGRRQLRNHGQRNQWCSEWGDFQRHLQRPCNLDTDVTCQRHPQLHVEWRIGECKWTSRGHGAAHREYGQGLLQRQRRSCERRHQPFRS